MYAPRLRFKEFSDNWKQKTINDIAKITMGQSPKGETYSSNKKDTILIQGNADLINGKVVPRVYTSQPTKMCERGDIILSVRAPVGELAISQYNACIGRGVCAIQNDTNFLFHYLSKLRENGYWKKISQGSTFESVNSDVIKNHQLSIPSENEQTKITYFFDRLDNKINLQQEKIDLLKEQKKGYMEKIFSQELRFKDENGKEYPEWTQVTLKDIALSINYGMNAAAKEFDGKNIYLRITDIDDVNRTFIESSKVSPDATLDEKYRLQKGDILFARTGASVGKSFYFSNENRPFYFAGFLIRVRLENNVNSNFVYQNTLTSSYKQWVKIMSMRSGQPGINGEEYGSFSFKLPCLEEQSKIANFLSRIDQLVLLEEKKLQILQDQKQSFIQQMFI